MNRLMWSLNQQDSNRDSINNLQDFFLLIIVILDWITCMVMGADIMVLLTLTVPPL